VAVYGRFLLNSGLLNAFVFNWFRVCLLDFR